MKKPTIIIRMYRGTINDVLPDLPNHAEINVEVIDPDTDDFDEHEKAVARSKKVSALAKAKKLHYIA